MSRHIRDRGVPVRDGRDMERFLDWVEEVDSGPPCPDEVPAESAERLAAGQVSATVSRWS